MLRSCGMVFFFLFPSFFKGFGVLPARGKVPTVAALGDRRMGKGVLGCPPTYLVPSPDAGAGVGADIEDLLWVFERRGVQFVVHEHKGVLVGDIVALDVPVVRRSPVLGGLGRLIRAAMDDAVFVDARRYG